MVDLFNLSKRIIDVIGALVGIIIFSPIMLATALYIKLVSPDGPVLADTPKRAGKNRKEFRMFKFRSMIPNAHEWMLQRPEIYKQYQANGYKFKAEEDPRLIKGAIFIRKSSIDEMPQFFNVLLGHMSIVGPRAYFPFELKEQLEKYPQAKEHVDQLLTIKPGITGPWQTGGRNEIGFVERVKMDAYYAKKKSIVYDIFIMLKTPYVVFTKKGVV